SYDLTLELPKWVSPGVKSVTAPAGKTTTAPDLLLTKGGIISIRMVEAKTRQPIKLPPESRALIVAQAGMQTIGSGGGFTSWLDPNASGRFELQVFPGQFQLYSGDLHVGDERKWAGAGQIVAVNVAEGQIIEADLPMIDAKDIKITGKVILAPSLP